jgi:type IV pilus assembly protein PilB
MTSTPEGFLPAVRTGNTSVARRVGASLPLTTGQEYVDYVDVRAEDLDPALARLMDVETCRRLRVVPIAADTAEVTVALADATDLMLLDDLRARFAPREVALVTTSDEAMDRVLERWAALTAKDAETAALAGLAGTDHADAPSADVLEASDDNGRMAQLVARLLEQAVSASASDVHLEPGETRLHVRFRHDGVLRHHDDYPLTIAPGVINRLKVMGRMEISERRLPQDGKFHRTLAGREVDCRLVTIPTAGGYESATVRLLDQSRSRLALADIGFTPAVYGPLVQALKLPHGMILVTGPTGSGKTTTLYAGLGELATGDRKVLTVEDPVEIRYPTVTQVQVNERAGLTFASALRSFLRADPDVILVGEIRDKETASLAAQASLTGHLVLSTLHTNEASGAPTRLLNMGLEGFVVASALKAVLAQRLLRRLCKRCAVQYEPKAAELEAARWEETGLPAPDTLWRPGTQECTYCRSRGYSGRLAAAELLVITPEIADAVSHSAPSVELERIARTSGAPSLHADALGWAAAGETSLDEVGRVGA